VKALADGGGPPLDRPLEDSRHVVRVDVVDPPDLIQQGPGWPPDAFDSQGCGKSDRRSMYLREIIEYGHFEPGLSTLCTIIYIFSPRSDF